MENQKVNALLSVYEKNMQSNQFPDEKLLLTNESLSLGEID